MPPRRHNSPHRVALGDADREKRCSPATTSNPVEPRSDLTAVVLVLAVCFLGAAWACTTRVLRLGCTFLLSSIGLAVLVIFVILAVLRAYSRLTCEQPVCRVKISQCNTNPPRFQAQVWSLARPASQAQLLSESLVCGETFLVEATVIKFKPWATAFLGMAPSCRLRGLIGRFDYDADEKLASCATSLRIHSTWMDRQGRARARHGSAAWLGEARLGTA